MPQFRIFMGTMGMGPLCDTKEEADKQIGSFLEGQHLCRVALVCPTHTKYPWEECPECNPEKSRPVS